ncbi:alpha/beta hydrolase [Roseiconus nitratireducens]|uniref:Alpha/beta hydrolase n=1 Tax=Roseiconus nitratireducens TaxID=2605748 RepID=A0A5M6CXR0_9BACT|nr:alpha/beta hydrolase [Roseiconus nitratireducens]KAA5540008.1 alpha/beta hydrolase [Roseiconus nitratireducens]
MPDFTTNDGTRIFFKDWGVGQPILFSHGWPLNGDAWDPQMLFFGEHDFRVIAHDRRSHGRSSQTWHGNDMNTYADDLAGLIDSLDLQDLILIGHSTGGGEITRYLGRHGTSRVAKAVLVGAVPPLMLKTRDNPGGLPLSVFDEIRQGTRKNRSQFFREITAPFYGYNREGSSPSEGVCEAFWLQGMQGGIKGQYDCIAQFSETDFTQDLKQIDIPVLIVHGDDDQIVPIGASAHRADELLRNSTLKVYPGSGHGLTQTDQDRFNQDILEFVQG